MKIFAYKKGSKSAKALSQALGVKRLKHEGSKFKGNLTKVVLNWGASTLPEEVCKCRVINQTDAVRTASNKLNAFLKIQHVLGDKAPIPQFTKDIEVAKGWINEGNEVVCRTVLNGHSGAGIVVSDSVDKLVAAPLYVKYIKKQQEYRVHVFKGEVIDVQRKARRKETPDEAVNWKIRNHANGFIFARGDANPSPCVTEAARECVLALDLDFGAVDVVWNEHSKKAYVLEVNTAPGLEGTTLEKYAKAIKEIYNV